MIEVDSRQQLYEVSDLDAAALLDYARDADVQARAAERRKLRLTLQWCLDHVVADPDEAATWGEGQRGAAGDCDLTLGGEGTPLVRAGIAESLAAAFGVSTQSGSSLMSDALDLAYRLPRLQAQVEDLSLPVWKARRVAQDTFGLSREAAAFVDDQLADRARGFGVITIDRIVALAIAKFHPELIDEATKAANAHWNVELEHPLPGDFTGTSHLNATGDTLALTRFLELVTIVAIALGKLGDTDPLPVRKAKAIGVIADPDELADLLTRADHSPGSSPDDDNNADAGDAGAEAGEEAKPSGATPTPTNETPTGADTPPAPATDGPSPEPRATTDQPSSTGSSGAGSSGTGSTKRRQPRPNTGVVGGLVRKPAKVKLYAHLSAADLATMAAATGETVVIGEVERLGPATLGKIREWLGTTGATITPVIDLNRTDAVDVHDPPEWMRELVILRDQHCVFPWCATDARSCDIDHIEPYHHGPEAGRPPPGQTRPDNLAPLCRRHHRAKTFKGWSYRRLPDGSYRWKDPYGNTYLVTKNGTHNLNSN